MVVSDVHIICNMMRRNVRGGNKVNGILALTMFTHLYERSGKVIIFSSPLACVDGVDDHIINMTHSVSVALLESYKPSFASYMYIIDAPRVCKTVKQTIKHVKRVLKSASLCKRVLVLCSSKACVSIVIKKLGHSPEKTMVIKRTSGTKKLLHNFNEYLDNNASTDLVVCEYGRWPKHFITTKFHTLVAIYTEGDDGIKQVDAVNVLNSMKNLVNRKLYTGINQ